MSLETNKPLLAQFEEHLVLSQLAPATVVNYMADLRAFARWCEDRVDPGFSLTSLHPEIIRAYRTYLFEEKGCAASTVNRRLQTLRKFCAFAVQAGLMASNSAQGIRLVPSNNNQGTSGATPEPLTTEEIAMLLKASSSEQPGLARRDTAIVMLLAHTGLRVSELVDLHLDDVKFNHPGIHLAVKNSSHDSIRNIPLEGDARSALYDYLQVRPNVEEPHLFLSREGRPLSARSVQRIVSLRARAAGLDGVSPQALRRTYARHLLAATGDLALVSERLGHQDPATTQRYVNANGLGQSKE